MPCLRANFLLLSLLLAACGEKGGETESVGGSSTTTEPPGTGSTLGESSTTDAPTTGEPAACVDPSLVEFGPAVQITLHNAGATRLFVNLQEECTRVLPIELRDADDVAVDVNRSDCEFSCETALAGNCGCPAGCGLGSVIQLEPGGTWPLQWSGQRWVEAELPAECPAEDCSPSCLAADQAPDGAYTVSARAFDMATECDTCTCEPGPEGSCELMFAFASGAEALATAALDYPAQTAVELVFE